MTDHLPECYCFPYPIGVQDCICSALRACEQRVTGRLVGLAEDAERGGYLNGYAAGVQAARDAVEQNMLDMTQLHIAFAAIDALKGEQA